MYFEPKPIFIHLSLIDFHRPDGFCLNNQLHKHAFKVRERKASVIKLNQAEPGEIVLIANANHFVSVSVSPYILHQTVA